jgi:hypothetical protein
MIYRATVNDNVLARRIEFATVLVLTRLEADSVITYVELRVEDQYILRSLEVETVTILAIPWVYNEDVVDDDVVATEWVQAPCRRVLETYLLDKYVFAAVEVEEHWTEEVTILVPILFVVKLYDVHVGLSKCIEDRLGRSPDLRTVDDTYYTTLLDTILPLALCELAAADPTPGITVTIDSTETGDRDILLALSAEWRLATTGLEALEVAIYNRIVVEVASEVNHGTIDEVKVDVAFEGDRTGYPDSVRHDQVTATNLAERLHGVVKGLCIICDTITYATEVGDLLFEIRYSRAENATDLERQILCVEFQVNVGLERTGTLIALLATRGRDCCYDT